jgi:uncharacterized membrane protein
MSVRRADAVPRNPYFGLAALLLVLASGALWFIDHNALHYSAYDAGTYGDFWPRRFGLIPHVLGGMTAALAGLVQLWLGLTGRVGRWHRRLGRIYVAGVAVGSVGAFYLALTIDPKYFAYAAGLFGLACAWAVTTSMALFAVQQRALEQHREWMIRSYVVTFAFVTFRLVEKILLPLNIAPAQEIDSLLAFGCWSVPLLLAEPLIQLRRIARRRYDRVLNITEV